MAHFYGTIQGSRGQASRLGTRGTGLTTYAASWEGAVRVYMYEKDGVDLVQVELVQHQGAGVNRLLYSGPVGGREHD